MKKLIFISAQPAHDYFLWQLEVQLYNIYIEKKMDVNYHILLSHDGKETEKFNILQEKYPLIQLYQYKDEREDRRYTPSIQIHLLYQHFKKNPDLTKQVFMLIDSDIVFTDKQLDLEGLLDNDICYLSDTASYLDPTYLDSKGDDLLTCMCAVAKVEEEKVRNKAKDHGGAQYILKNIDSSFWLKVEQDSNKFYKYLTNSVEIYRSRWSEKTSKPKEEYHPVQAWTASMWAMIYNLVFFNHQFEVHENLSFCWPGNETKNWDLKPIFHNAGVTNNQSKMFYKGEFINKRPIVNIATLDKAKCSSKYAEIVKAALSV